MTKAEDFLAAHVPGRPLLMPNAWDAGAARVLEHLGFGAVATTSSGAASTFGRLDSGLTRDESLHGAAAISAAVDVPVSADLENCFADDPDGVAETVRLARTAGLAGCSVEDWDPVAKQIYPFDLAVDRVRAAVDAADGIVITARAEGVLRGASVADVVERAAAFAEAGAPVVFTPGIRTAEDIRTVVDAVEVPLNVLVRGGMPSIAELADLGVARISVGGSFTWAAYDGLVQAATELRDHGTYGYWANVERSLPVVWGSFTSNP